MNKEEIKLEKISYEELQDKYIDKSTQNYILINQNRKLSNRVEKLNTSIIKALNHIECWFEDYKNSYEIESLKEILLSELYYYNFIIDKDIVLTKEGDENE